MIERAPASAQPIAGAPPSRRLSNDGGFFEKKKKKTRLRRRSLSLRSRCCFLFSFVLRLRRIFGGIRHANSSGNISSTRTWTRQGPSPWLALSLEGVEGEKEQASSPVGRRGRKLLGVRRRSKQKRRIDDVAFFLLLRCFFSFSFFDALLSRSSHFQRTLSVSRGYRRARRRCTLERGRATSLFAGTRSAARERTR